LNPTGQTAGWHGPPTDDEKPIEQIGFCAAPQSTDDVTIGTRIFAHVAASKVAAFPVVISIRDAFTS
jgi:hypothetical protein